MSNEDFFEDEGINVEIRRGSLPLTQLGEIEQRFFDIVEKGTVAEVQQFLQNYSQLDLNSENYQGLTALHIAVKKERTETVNLLLSLPQVDLKDIALHSVATGNLEMTETILNAMQRRGEHEFKTYDNSPEFSSDITPLILAAQCGNFNMIRMLINRNHTITRPHLPKCLCAKCKSDISEAASSLSRIRLNCYKALANPAYICQATPDPIHYGFVLDREMKNCALIDKEFRAEYTDFCHDLQQFLVDFVGCCRNPKEVEIILKCKSGCKGNRNVSFPRLKMAIDYNQKEFVAHSLVQQVLTATWLGGYKSWNRFSLPEMCLRVLMRIFVLPILAIAIIFAPNSKFSQKYQAPINKYISSLASYILFVCMVYGLSGVDQQRSKRGPPQTGLEGPVVIYVFGFIWGSINQMWIEGFKRYFRVPWHWYDVTMEFTFLITFFYWTRSHALTHDKESRDLERKYWPGYDKTLFHEGFFAIGCILAFGRFGFYCLQSSRLGPLQVSMGKMAIQIANFLVFCFILITSFAVPMTKLYIYYDGMTQTDKDGVTRSQLDSFSSFYNSFGTFFWAIFGMSPKEAIDVVIENEGGDKVNPKINHHNFTEGIGRLFFSLYEILMGVALLNTLIAILSNTFEKVQSNADIEWKFARTKLWIYFFHEESCVPCPYNLIPNASNLISCKNYCLAFANKTKGQKAKFSFKNLCYIEYEEESIDTQLAQYEAVLTNLVQRYFRSKEE